MTEAEFVQYTCYCLDCPERVSPERWQGMLRWLETRQLEDEAEQIRIELADEEEWWDEYESELYDMGVVDQFGYEITKQTERMDMLYEIQEKLELG